MTASATTSPPGMIVLFAAAWLLFFPPVCSAQIDSFDHAQDKLVADVFAGGRPSGEVFGNPDRLTGAVAVRTTAGTVDLGEGPGWVFFVRDAARVRPLNRLVLVTTSGSVSRKIVKGEPLDLSGYRRLSQQSNDLQGAAGALTSLEDAYARLIHGLLGHTPGNRRIYARPGELEGRVTVENWQALLFVGHGPGWLFFIDDNPAANWEHGCRFALVNESGAISVVKSMTPPKDPSPFLELTDGPPDLEGANVIPRTAQESLTGKRDLPPPNTPAANRWAVVISGGYNQPNNHVRYWNDCAYFYATLIAHGFLDENIYVLMSDGTDPSIDRSNGTNSPTDLDADGDADIQYSATRANVTTVFDLLAGALDAEDVLYVFATDHGGSNDAAPYDDPTVKLYLWGETMTDAEFATEVDKVTTLATVCIFEQCYSGGMLDNLQGSNRVLLSAARFWELSYAMGPSYTYDEFSYYLTYGFANPSAADANADGVVSMEEGYLYALANDSYQSEALNGFLENVGEHPSYYSNPWDLGRKISLAGYDSDAEEPAYDGTTQREVQETFPTGGVPQAWSGDDFVQSCSLPFSFPWHGTTYSQVAVDSNGVLYLGSPPSSDPNNSLDQLKTRHAIAPIWDDLTVYAADGDAVYVAADTSWVTIRWQAHTYVDDRPVRVAVKLGASGAVRFLYGTGNDHTSRIAGRDKTIGLSSGPGLGYHLCLRNGQADLGSANGVEFEPVTPAGAATSAAPAVQLLLFAD